MKKQHILFLIFLALFFFTASAFAEIRVMSVKGTAAYKAGGQWVPLQTGTALTVGTKVSTGVRSSVEIKINNHTLTVQPLTIMKISESMEDGKSSTTKIGLRRGSVRAKVAKDARIKTVFKVSTPVATSSVRGTEEIVIYSPTFGMRVIVLNGTVAGEGLNGAPQFLSGNLEFWQKLYKGDPENPMAGMEEFITQTHSLFITLDEEQAYNLFGDDFLNYAPPTPGSQNQNVVVPVAIYLIWP